MRSVFPENSKLFISLALAIAGCSAQALRDDGRQDAGIPKTILNARLLETIGPVLSDDVSLRDPFAVAVNKMGEILVSDRGANGVYRFSPDLNYISTEGGIGSVEGSFNGPLGMACDQALNLYIAESGNRRIQILDRNLRRVRAIESYFDENDSPVNFTRPQDIFIDREGNIWIADNDKVLKLDPFFELLLEMSYDAPGRFDIGLASSVDISDYDLVAVADPGNRRVLVGTIHGNTVTEIPANKPSCARWDEAGLIWVSDPAVGKVEAFDESGNLVFKLMENLPGFKPSWLAFDLSGRLIVVDSGGRKLLAYDIVRGTR